MPQTQDRGERVDLFHYHIVWDGFLKMKWRNARSLFEEIMVATARDINYVTVLRDPVQHWLSYYYFYIQPETRVSGPGVNGRGVPVCLSQRKRFSW